MARTRTDAGSELSRRTFLAATGGALVGAAAYGLVRPTPAEAQQPKRGGVLRFATRADAAGLDPHRNTMYLVSVPLAATTQGLLDLNLKSEPVPGIATEWDIAKDLLTYTLKLRKGAQFHNGRDIDAAAVKWNFERMQDAKIGHSFTRSALVNLKEIQVLDTHTIRCHLHEPSAVFLSELVYYPCNLIAPDSADKANEMPIGCGPFKFVKWERNSVTELARFEHYFETDEQGRSLPYLDGLIGLPKKEDQVRLTALRAGEVELIDNMTYVDAAEFPKKYMGKFQTWDVPTLGTSYLIFNLDKGPFTDKRLRQAAAHAIDHNAIRQAVFYGRGEVAKSFYASASPWHTAGAKSWPEYDPDKAKFLLRQAKAVGTEILLQSLNGYPYTQQTAELAQAMWSEVGFKVVFNLYEAPVLAQKNRERDFHAESTGGSYRWDPDGWFSRQFLSTSPSNAIHSGFRNEKCDRLIAEARSTLDRKKRLELYTELESIVNEELPVLYVHHLTALQAGAMNVHGYQPAISGPFSTKGGGIRTAWLA